jgi:hypothetical protein
MTLVLLCALASALTLALSFIARDVILRVSRMRVDERVSKPLVKLEQDMVDLDSRVKQLSEQVTRLSFRGERK